MAATKPAWVTKAIAVAKRHDSVSPEQVPHSLAIVGALWISNSDGCISIHPPSSSAAALKRANAPAAATWLSVHCGLSKAIARKGRVPESLNKIFATLLDIDRLDNYRPKQAKVQALFDAKEPDDEANLKTVKALLPDVTKEHVLAYLSLTEGRYRSAYLLKKYPASEIRRIVNAHQLRRCSHRDYSALALTLVEDMQRQHGKEYKLVMKNTKLRGNAEAEATADQGIRLSDTECLPYKEIRFFVQDGKSVWHSCHVQPFVVVTTLSTTAPKGTKRAPDPVLTSGAYAHGMNSASPVPVAVWGVKHASAVLLTSGEVYTTHDGDGLIPFLDILISGGITKQFAMMFNHCVMCGAELTSTQSLEKMMGPTCARRASSLSAGLHERTGALNRDGRSWIRSSFAEPSNADMSSVVLKTSEPTVRMLQAAVKKAAEQARTHDADAPLAVLDDAFDLPLDELYDATVELLASATGCDVDRCKQALYHACVCMDEVMHLIPPETCQDVQRALDVLGFTIPP